MVSLMFERALAKDQTNRACRKPYVVRKSREKWSTEEHERFVEAVSRFGRNWSSIVEFIGTRSVAQVRSHAQKYFLKLQHQGKADAVPPPRPKRRSTKPYPIQPKSQASSYLGPAFEPCPSSSPANSNAGQDSNEASSTPTMSTQEESSESYIDLPDLQDAHGTHTQVPVSEHHPGSLTSVPEPSDIGRLYRAMDVILQRPNTGQAFPDPSADSSRDTLVAKLQQLRAQLDSRQKPPEDRDQIVAENQPDGSLPASQQPAASCMPNALYEQPQISSFPADDAHTSAWSAGMSDTFCPASTAFLPQVGSPFYTGNYSQQFQPDCGPPQGLTTISSLASGASQQITAAWTLPPAAQMPAQSQQMQPHSWGAQPDQTAAGMPTSSSAFQDTFNFEDIPDAADMSSLLPTADGSAADEAGCSKVDCSASAAACQQVELDAENVVKETCQMLRPPSFPAGLDLEGIEPWTMDDAAMISVLDDASCSNESSIADLDPCAWLNFE